MQTSGTDFPYHSEPAAVKRFAGRTDFLALIVREA
jgi:hypothetical protein